jgi:NuA3 HAT complex component NTO1
MQAFDPIGTTIHEERWTGRDVMRGMSEELSELDEDELKDLVDDELDPGSNNAPANAGQSQKDVRRTRRGRFR